MDYSNFFPLKYKRRSRSDRERRKALGVVVPLRAFLRSHYNLFGEWRKRCVARGVGSLMLASRVGCRGNHSLGKYPAGL